MKKNFMLSAIAAILVAGIASEASARDRVVNTPGGGTTVVRQSGTVEGCVANSNKVGWGKVRSQSGIRATCARMISGGR